MRKYLQDTESILRYRDEAVKIILAAKNVDSKKDGRKYSEIGQNMIDEGLEYHKEVGNFLDSSQNLNINPSHLPERLHSYESILRKYGEKYGEIEWEGAKLIPLNIDSSLTKDHLDNLVSYWLNLFGKGFEKNNNYYFNNAFYFNILFIEGQREHIRAGNFDRINFFMESADRPMIYSYDPSYINSEEQLSQIEKLLEGWKRKDLQHDSNINELAKEQEEASRGDFWVNSDHPYGLLYSENDRIIYEISSRFFWSYMDSVYGLSETHPHYFQRGARTLIDGLYEFYLNYIFGDGSDISKEEFLLKATQQFLYFSSDNKKLRVDLFRHIDEKKKNIDEVFTGGIFHVFDHFKDFRISSKSKGDIEYHEGKLFEIVCNLFFNHSQSEKEDEESIVYIADNEYETPIERVNETDWLYKKKAWHGVFFYDKKKDLYYVTTIYLKD